LLMTACIHGNPLLVRTLIEEGAAVNAADNVSQPQYLSLD